MKVIDLSHSVEHKMTVYPGDSEVSLVKSYQYDEHGYTNHHLSVSMHIGTHIDGPMHLSSSQQFIHDIPLGQFIGDAVIIDARGEAEIGFKESYEQLIPEQGIVIIHTGFEKKYGSHLYYEAHPNVSFSFAELLVRKSIKMVGLDMPSPDYDPYPIHKYLLEHGILIAENLCNTEQLLVYQRFTIFALPLKIMADSSPARIIALLDGGDKNGY